MNLAPQVTHCENCLLQQAVCNDPPGAAHPHKWKKLLCTMPLLVNPISHNLGAVNRRETGRKFHRGIQEIDSPTCIAGQKHMWDQPCWQLKPWGTLPADPEISENGSYWAFSLPPWVPDQLLYPDLAPEWLQTSGLCLWFLASLSHAQWAKFSWHG